MPLNHLKIPTSEKPGCRISKAGKEGSLRSKVPENLVGYVMENPIEMDDLWFYGDLMMIYCDLMMIYDDLMMIYDDLMMIYDDLWWFGAPSGKLTVRYWTCVVDLPTI